VVLEVASHLTPHALGPVGLARAGAHGTSRKK
jgi:hypothetical protein